MAENAVNLGSAYAELKLKKDGFSQGITQAQSELNAFRSQASLVADGLKGVGGTLTSVGKTLTASVTTPIIGLGTAAVKTTAQFDTSMSKVQALSGATGKDFDTLRDKAQEMGRTTAFTASEAADAFSYMALAGWDTEQMLDGIDGVLNLAAASQMDLAEASDMVTDYLTAFGLEAAEAGRMANQMAYAQANSNTTTQQLGDAFGNCAAQMHTAGQTMETTTALLEAMANQGTKGSEAGTALAAVMRDITQKMDDGAIAIGDTSVAVMDQNGNFRNLIDIMADVEKATDGMGSAEKSAALMSTFTARSIKAVGEILTEGTDSIYGYAEALESTDGVAKDMADTMLNNLSGQLTILKSNIEGLMIQIGDLLMPKIKEMVSRFQEIVTWFTELDEGQKEQIIKWAGIAAAIGPVLVVVGKLVSGVGGLIATGVNLSKWISRTAAAFGLLEGGATGIGAALSGLAATAGPILAVIAALSALALGLKAVYDQGGQFKESVDNLMATLGEFASGALEKVKESFENFKAALEPIIEMFKNSFDFEAVDGALAGVTDALGNLLSALKPVFDMVWDLVMNVINVQLLPVFSVIGGLINGVISALGPLINTIKDIINIVTDVVNIVVGLLRGLVTGDFTQFLEGVSSLKTDIEAFITDMIDTIVTFISGFFEGLFESFDSFSGGLLTDIGTFFTNMWNTISEFFTVTIPNAFNEFITVTLPNFIQNAKEFFDKLPENLGFALGYALQSLINWGRDAVEWVRVNVPIIINNIIDWFKQLPGKIWEWLTETLNRINSWGQETVEKGKKIAKDFFDGMVDWFKKLPDKIKKFIDDIPRKIKQAKHDMEQAGKDIMNGLWNGLKSIWDGINKWFEGVVNTVKNFVRSIAEGMASANSASAGSHADGLAYVPYNGYKATLHEGERVLTKNEAAAYNSGSGGGYVFNYYSPKAIDPYEANKLFRRSVRELEGGFA